MIYVRHALIQPAACSHLLAHPFHDTRHHLHSLNSRNLFREQQATIRQSSMRHHRPRFLHPIGRKHRQQHISLIAHQRTVFKPVSMIIHIPTVKQECTVFGLRNKIIPHIVHRWLVSPHINYLALVFFIIMRVSSCIIRMRSHHHTHCSFREVTQAAPNARGYQYPHMRRIHMHHSLCTAIVNHHIKATTHRDHNLCTLIMRMCPTFLPFRDIINPKDSFHLKWYIVAHLSKRQTPALITSLGKRYQSATSWQTIIAILNHHPFLYVSRTRKYNAHWP